MRMRNALGFIVLAVISCRGQDHSTAPSATVAPTAPSETAAASAGPLASQINVSNFDADKSDAAPLGFSFDVTGAGRPGRWIVQRATDAPSAPNVLAQLDADPTDNRFPVAVIDTSSFKDVRLSVSCKSLAGKVDRACGLVWRFKDAKNYYVTRANALEDNVRLYHVKDGNRIQFASWSGKVTPSIWHKLAVDAQRDHFVVSFDDRKVLDATDTTFTEAGKVGVWTKADSVTEFDDLSASAL